MMDILNLIAGFQQFVPEFMASYCIVNGAIMNLNEIQNMGYNEFSLRSKLNMPLQLYRYYPNIEDRDKNVNYSIQALENNTVFLQTPTAFDDVYDSDIHIDYSVYEHLRLIEYCKRCGLYVDISQPVKDIGDAFVKVLYEYYAANGNLEHVFRKTPDSEVERISNKLFISNVIIELCRTRDFGKATAAALRAEYCYYRSKLQTTFRTTCFATTPYSQLMWGGSYANFHNGFCIEYTILPNDKAYEDVYYNLFPMIYCKSRPDMTSRLVAAKDKEFTTEILWIYTLMALCEKA